MPEHGTRTMYNYGCRCDECRDANKRHCKSWPKRKAMEDAGARESYYVDAGPVREHVAKLLASGWTKDGICRDFGLYEGTLDNLMVRHRGTGRRVSKMKRENAEVLMAIEPLRKAMVCPVCSMEINHNDSMYWDGIHLRCYVATRGGTEEQLRLIAAADRKAEQRKRKEAQCFTS